MKKILVLLSVLFVANVAASAQDYEAKYGPNYQECMKYLSFYQEAYKTKDYTSALASWRIAYNICKPTCSENMYIQGATMYRREISAAKDAALKEALIDTLLAVQDRRVEFFPKNKDKALMAKAQDVLNYYKTKDPQKSYDLVVPVVLNETKANSTLPVIENSFDVACKLYKSGALSAEELINLYDAYCSILEESAKSNKNPDMLEKTQTNLEGLFIGSEAANCDNLLALYTPKFQDAPEDIALAKNIVKFLSRAEDCMNNDLFLKAINLIYRNEPTHESAWFLYRLHSSRNETAKAIEKLQEAIAFDESDTMDDAKYNLELARFAYKNDNGPLAVRAANQVIALDPSRAGQANMIIASVWISATCKGDEIESKAKYWIAVDYLQKAKEADITLTEDCNARISDYSKHFPKIEEAFMYDLKQGDPYTFNCGGLSAKTIVRLQK